MIADKSIHVWVTKYALTSGVFEAEARLGAPDINEKYVFIGYSGFTLGNDAFLSKEEAVADVKKRIADKRKSIEKQLKKLSKLEAALSGGG